MYNPKRSKLLSKSNDAILLHGNTDEKDLSSFIEIHDKVNKIFGYSTEELLNMSPIEIDKVHQTNIDDINMFKNFLLWRSDITSKCSYVNRSWSEFTGKTLEQEIGDGWQEGLHPDDLKRYFKKYTEAFKKRESYEIEYRLRRYDGEYRLIICKCQPFYDLAGKFSGYLGSCFDITDWKQREKLLTLGELAMDMAHEIKNPLTIIKGLIDLMEIDESFEGNLEIVNRLKAAIIRLDNAVNNCLKFSKIKYYTFNPLDINEVIIESLNFLEPLLLKKKIRLELDLSKEVLMANTDSCLLQQVVINLVMNSLDAEGTRNILVASKYNFLEGSNIITVQDDGCGIDYKIINKIFDPFFTTKNAGSGLGLSIVSKIINEFQGNIRVNSTLNEGSTFIIEIPAC